MSVDTVMSLRACVVSEKALTDYGKINRNKDKNFIAIVFVFINIESGVKTSPTSFPRTVDIY